jgi:hypothetical protein
MRDRMADALCICRRLRSRAVIGLELLLFDNPDAFVAVLEDELAFDFAARLRDGAAGAGSGSFSGFVS